MTLRNGTRTRMWKRMRREGAFSRLCFGEETWKKEGDCERRIYGGKKEWKCVKWLNKVSAEMEFDTYTFMRINLIHVQDSNVKEEWNTYTHMCCIAEFGCSVGPPPPTPPPLHSSSPISISHIIFDSIFFFICIMFPFEISVFVLYIFFIKFYCRTLQFFFVFIRSWRQSFFFSS